MEIILCTETKQILGQRMYQSMNLLQMGIEELSEYMHDLSMENPLIEENTGKTGSFIARSGGGKIKRQNGQNLELPIPDKVLNTLKMALDEQVQFLHLPEATASALRTLLLNLDEKGFLPEDFTKTKEWKKRPREFAEARRVLQSLEPAGVGACNISECLCLQLERMGMKDTLAYTICKDYLQHLARNHFNHIAKSLNVDENQIIEAKAVITALNPVPSNGFDEGNIPYGRCQMLKSPLKTVSLLWLSLTAVCQNTQ